MTVQVVELTIFSSLLCDIHCKCLKKDNNATSRPAFHCYFGWKEERESRPVFVLIISGVERFWNSSLSFNGEAQGVYDCGR